jgi:hypothetical protein
MHAVPLDLVFALTPLLVLGLLQFLDDEIKPRRVGGAWEY